MADDSERPIRVLSLDGGGVRGLSSILILGHIMRNINTQRKKNGKEPQEPWQYFDLIGGTSTGGIIALMLGRLRMTIPECITAYTELSETIFKPKQSWASPLKAVEYLNGDGKFDSQALEKEIKTQIQKSKVAENDQILLMDTESPCKVCVFALQEEDSTLAILRTYDYPNASQTLFEECKVWEACRATSAAPTFFDPIQMGPYKQSFIDGGLRYNNPIFKVYGEAQEIWPDRTIVATSIGTGEAPGTKFGGNLIKIAESITKIVTGCDVVADDFYKSNKTMVDEGRYFRLSVTHGLGDIGLEEYKNIQGIVSRTQTYLATGEPQAKLKQCIMALLKEHDPRHNDFKNDACLESLTFLKMNFRKDTIVNANDDTCEWLLENKNYTHWIQSDDGLLWIQGKAGAGKSTLMKYIYGKIQTPTVNVPSLKLSFFFHSRGDKLQKTRLGMFRSLLAQLYKGDSTAREEIRKEFNKNSADGMVEIKWEWTEKMLEGLFDNLICQISKSKNVTIFVDALDEAGKEVANDLVNGLANLYDKVQRKKGTVKICFSSRHYPILLEKVAENQKVVVERENGKAIQSFVKTKFEQTLKKDGPIKAGKASLELEGEIALKANGVFQWVCLVLPIIFTADAEREQLDFIRRRLDELPKDLNDMYWYILRDLVHKQQPAEVLRLFRWVLFAARPLSVEEIRHGMAVLDILPPSRGPLNHCIDYGKRIIALSGGLIEVSTGTVVQVSHQTVGDFFLKEGLGFLTVRSSSEPENPEGHSKGLCHNMLARLCVNYLWTENVRQQSSKMSWDQLLDSNTLPFLQYAIAAVFWHASNAEQNGYHQEMLLEQFGYCYTRKPKSFKSAKLEQGVFSLWCSAGITYCRRDNFGVLPFDGSTLLHIASMANILSLVEILLKRGAKVGEKDELGQQAIHYAARGGAMEVSKILIKSSSPLFLSSVVNAKDNNFVTPLQIAARNYKESVMRLLITKGAKAKCLNERNSRNLEEVRRDTEKTVSLLLKDAAEFNAQSLQSAAASGDLVGVRLHLAEGTDVNAQGGYYGCALVAAVFNGHDAIAMELLQKGAEVNAQGGLYGNALVTTAMQGHEEMIYILLQAGAEIDAKGMHFASALVAAAARGHAEVVNILLKGGAKINTYSERSGNALGAAASNGHIEVVIKLLEGGANINAQSGEYGNALMSAIHNGKDAVAMLLLKRGAKTNALSGRYKNALELAARGSQVAIVQALLEAKDDCGPLLASMIDADRKIEEGPLEVVLLVAAWMGRLDIVDKILMFNDENEEFWARTNLRVLDSKLLNAKGGTIILYSYYTALQLSAVAGHTKVVARLLAAGADVNASAFKITGRTALQAAAEGGQLDTVETLLAAGANVNSDAADMDGRTALQAAAEHGELEIIERLLAAGADVNKTNKDGRCGCTALASAARNGHLKVVQMLLPAGANPNITIIGGPRSGGCTALQEAAEFGYVEIIKTLLSAGANVDSDIKRAISIATGHGHVNVVSLLQESRPR